MKGFKRFPKKTTKSTQAIAPRLNTLPVLREPIKRWLIGWKASNLVLDVRSERIMFFRTIWDGIIENPDPPSATAECWQFPWHNAPAHDCRCGFNAYSERSTAEAHVRHAVEERLAPRLRAGACRESIVLLRVGLKGRAIEGAYSETDTRWGYRAEMQQVTDVFIPRACQSCESAVVGFTLEPCAAVDGLFVGMHYAKPVCSHHLGSRSVTLSQMRTYAAKDAIAIHWNDE